MKNTNCTNCNLHQNASIRCDWGVGPSPCDVMILTREPISNDASTLELIDTFLAAAKLSRNNVYITSICKCKTRDKRIPNVAEFAACKPYLSTVINSCTSRSLYNESNSWVYV